MKTVTKTTSTTKGTDAIFSCSKCGHYFKGMKAFDEHVAVGGALGLGRCDLDVAQKPPKGVKIWHLYYESDGSEDPGWWQLARVSRCKHPDQVDGLRVINGIYYT